MRDSLQMRRIKSLVLETLKNYFLGNTRYINLGIGFNKSPVQPKESENLEKRTFKTLGFGEIFERSRISNPCYRCLFILIFLAILLHP